MIKNYRILIPFNATWQDGCDYAQQTIRLLAKTNTVIAVPLAHQRSIWLFCLELVRRRSVYTSWKGARIFTPVAFLPLRRFATIKKINLAMNCLFLRFIFFLETVFSSLKKEQRNINASKWIGRAQSSLIWFFEPHYMPLCLQLLGNSWRSVYDAVDFWPGFTNEIGTSHFALLPKVTWVVVNSRALLRSVRLIRKDVIQVPLGFAAEDFAKQNQGRFGRKFPVNSSHSLTFGFIGQIGNRFNFDWLLQLVQAFPEHHFEFVGAVWSWKELDDTDMPAKVALLQSQPNCSFKPPVDKVAIPKILATFDIGLIPYDTTQIFNRNCHPMKLYEYWYAGKPIVATAITELQRYSHGLVATNRVIQAITWTKHLIAHGFSDADRQLVRERAVANSWEAKLAAISQVIAATDSAGAA